MDGAIKRGAAHPIGVIPKKMKYKNIKSFAHNFTHSFVSYENVVDGSIVIEDLKEITRSLSGERLVIYWRPEDSPIYFVLSASVVKSISNYQQWILQHASRHGIDLRCIVEMRTEIYRKPNHQLAVESVVIDDRGKIYRSSVDF